MSAITFRKLRADEIDVRISTCSEKGVSLLLYKDARCDMNILDETVGCLNWRREHSRDNANCTVYIWDDSKELWVGKEDTGTESYTEKEKGLASDSFKRACFNWGIGRELYTSPFIWIPALKVELKEKNGKPITYDKFTVESIEYDDMGKIIGLAIINKNKDCLVYNLQAITQPKTEAKVKDTSKGYQELLCVDCGQAIKGNTKVSESKIAEMSMKAFGRELCLKCAKKLEQEKNNENLPTE